MSVGQGQQYAVVDAIIYTVLDASDAPTSSAISPFPSISPTYFTPPPATTSDNTSPTTPPTNHALVIAVASICAATGLALIAAFALLCHRRQGNKALGPISNWFGIDISNIYRDPPLRALQAPPIAPALSSIPYSNRPSPVSYPPNAHASTFSELPPGQLYNPWPETQALHPPQAQHGYLLSGYQYQTNPSSVPAITGLRSDQSPHGSISTLPYSPASVLGESATGAGTRAEGNSNSSSYPAPTRE